MVRSATLTWRTVLVLGLALIAAPAQEKSEKISIEVVNGARVYFPANLSSGEKCQKAKPAVVSSARVFAAIPEYQEIKRRGLDPNSAEYLLFMKRASDRFKDAIDKTVSRGGYDLVSETGAVTAKGKSLPDITDEVIRNL